ncbi:hypothetical protein QOT17_022951 [Balamuthia mandrillaris]
MKVKDAPFRLDCAKMIGNSEYVFYEPISLGDFTLHCWQEKTREGRYQGTRSHPKGNASLERFSLSLYEDGQIVIPARDRRFSGFAWAKQAESSCLDTRSLQQAIKDICTTALRKK